MGVDRDNSRAGSPFFSPRAPEAHEAGVSPASVSRL